MLYVIRIGNILPKYEQIYNKYLIKSNFTFPGSDWEDPDDPMVIAETELNSAAISIDAAAKKLANLKPRISKHHVSIT